MDSAASPFAPASAGNVIASGGTLSSPDGINGSSASGIQINPTGVLDLSAGVSGTTTGTLANKGSAANALILGANNILVSTAYADANFGSGNTFNKHANLSATTGKILANGDNKQTLAGDVTAGTSASPALDFGNVHVAALLTRTYQIDNSGSASGPSVLFAIQPGANGGTVTDPRLSGSGIASSNIGPVAYGGASAPLSVTFAPNADGPLTGQFLHIANNFDNISEQTLSITGAAYNLAAPIVAGTPINLGNLHVGDPTLSAHFSLTNGAPADGFSEALDAATASPTGGIAISGTVNLLAPGASDTTSFTAALPTTAAAGHITGTALLNLTSDGAGSSALGQTVLTPVTLSASANIFRLASAAIPANITLTSIHVGDPLPSASFSLTNASANDGFSEKLDASILSTSGALSVAGTVNLLAPGATNSTGITATLGASSAAGHFTGNATLSLTSDGAGTSSLGQTSLSPVTLSASANVFRLASPSLATASLTLPNVHIGDPLPSAAFTVSNNVPNDGFSEKVNASISASTGSVTLSGSALQIAPGSSTNSLVATLGSTAAAGHFTGTANITAISDGTGTSNLGQTTLASIPVTASANVFRLAAPGTIPAINLGNVHVGDLASAHLSVSNMAPADGFSEKLLASFATHTGAVANTSGTTSVNPNTTDSTTLAVSFDTSIAGLGRTGTATVHFGSDGTGSSNLGITQLAAADQAVSVTANVFNFAQAALQKSSGGGTFTVTSPTSATLDFGILNPGDSAASLLSILNAATGTADTLAGSWTLAAPHFALSNFSPFSNITAGGAQNGLQVSFTAGNSGIFTDTAMLHPLSQNPSFSGPLPNLTLTLQATVNPLIATWNGGVGNWSDGSQWSSGPQVPLNGSPTNAVYAVTISAGTATLDVNANVGSLSLLGGTLKGAGNLTLSTGSLQGTLNISGTTTINAGLLTVGGTSQSAGAFTGTGSLLVSANTTLTSDGVTLGGTWTVNGTEIIRPSAISAATSKVSSLTLGGTANAWTGKIDLTTSKLIVEATVDNHATLLSQIFNQVQLGITGAGGIFSSALSSKVALAVMDNAVLNKGTFGGIPVDLNSILVGAELLGDANADGHVDLSDLSTVLNHFGSQTTAWTSGNFDGSSTIDLTDLSDVLNNFGATNLNANVSPAVSDVVATPEPGSLLALGISGALLLRRKPAMVAPSTGS